MICLENDSVYAFRNCGHLFICEKCFKNTDSDKLTKCISVNLNNLFKSKFSN